jgi:superfamily I DNA/RNA helicase
MSNFTPNARQQQCIDNTEGKYLVLAGPGTGKTYTIIERIKALISKGTNPERILALTFSQPAANEMKNRLDKELDILDSGVFVSTYHSFCLEVIKNHPQDFDLPDNYKIISDTVIKKFIKECLDKGMNVILEIETKGALQVKEKMPDAVLIFIVPPSLDELETRLRGRHTEDEETIQKRLSEVKKELESAKKYDYQVDNDKVENAILKLEEIIAGEQ